MRNKNVPTTVIKRLPRYYRYLEELLENNVYRISSKELAEIMNLTASQIRQDLNCFGGFGQQGYGYNVADLFSAIGKILGVEKSYKLIIIGVGNLGRTIASHIDFEKRGFQVAGLFDKDSEIIGTEVKGQTVRNVAELEDFCKSESPSVAVLCVSKAEGEKLVPQLTALGITAFWNFSYHDIYSDENKSIIAENIHLSDSIMTLCYQVKEREENKIKED